MKYKNEYQSTGISEPDYQGIRISGRRFLTIIAAAILISSTQPAYALTLKSSSFSSYFQRQAQGNIKSTTSLCQTISGALSSNNYRFKIGFIPTLMDTILSISIEEPKLWDINSTHGEVYVNRVITMTQTNKITVTNDGTGPETLELALIDPQGWTASTQPGNETYVLSGLFCNVDDIPQESNFNQDEGNGSEDVILDIEDTANPKFKKATQTIFGYSQSTANGVEVPPNQERSLYLQFKSPTITNITSMQEISIIVNCETP